MIARELKLRQIPNPSKKLLGLGFKAYRTTYEKGKLVDKPTTDHVTFSTLQPGKSDLRFINDKKELVIFGLYISGHAPMLIEPHPDTKLYNKLFK